MPKASGEAYRNIRLCVDAYENGVMTGMSYFPALDQTGRPFRSLMEFLVETEQILDDAGFPQSYTARRSFAAGGPAHAPETAVRRLASGEKATFDIRLLFRQHASWQGSITWVEQGTEMNFRSVLEMLLLMDSAMGEAAE